MKKAVGKRQNTLAAKLTLRLSIVLLIVFALLITVISISTGHYLRHSRHSRD